MTRVKKSCQLEINSKEWFQARCREEVPSGHKKEAQQACSVLNGNTFCRQNNERKNDKKVKKAANDIENRPKELWKLPDYGHLPNKPFSIDLKSAVGEFLANDIFDLDGNQPIESKIMQLTGGIIEVNPSDEAIRFYEERGDSFQMINVVVCCYAFEERDGILHGLPYHISLRPSQKKGIPSAVDVAWIKNFDLSKALEGNPHYMGFNPFTNAFGFYAIGPLPINKHICSDTIGIVYNTYFLASNYEQDDVTEPGICTTLLGENAGILNDYRKFRLKHYFKGFQNIAPIKIWGCDSPIELFLLQAMNHEKLMPKIQTYIFSDGTTFPGLQAMWQEGKKTKSLSKIITEADFFFEKEKIAIFCDSVAHHSSKKAKAKDRSIDEKLEKVGIESIRLTGVEIMKSPLESARKISSSISSRA